MPITFESHISHTRPTVPTTWCQIRPPQPAPRTQARRRHSSPWATTAGQPHPPPHPPPLPVPQCQVAGAWLCHQGGRAGDDPGLGPGRSHEIIFACKLFLQSAGKKTGFVTTTRMSHATPAALYAKTVQRCGRHFN